jgi:hypothetical protein
VHLVEEQDRLTAVLTEARLNASTQRSTAATVRARI